MTSNESALEILELDTLDDRRYSLSVKFARKFLKSNQTLDMFPLNASERNSGKYSMLRAQDF